MFKYLYGFLQLKNEETGEESFDALAITRRCDSYQHREMGQDTWVSAFYGGFANSKLKLDQPTVEGFNGESISCRCKTPEDQKHFKQLLDNPHDIFVGKARNQYMVALIVPAGFKPAGPMFDEPAPIEYKKVTKEEFITIFKEVFEKSYYY